MEGDYNVHLIRILNIEKVPVLFMLNWFVNINLIPIKIPIGHFNVNWQADSKFCIEIKRQRIGQDTLEICEQGGANVFLTVKI